MSPEYVLLIPLLFGCNPLTWPLSPIVNVPLLVITSKDPDLLRLTIASSISKTAP